MKKILKKILFGTNPPQEYLCLDLNEFKKPLKLILKSATSGVVKDMTHHHLFNGYRPLVITFDQNYLSEQDLENKNSILLTFLNDQKKILATIKLKLFKNIKVNSITYLIFEGVRGTNKFKNKVHHFTNNLRYNITSERKKNIFLTGNLYDQVKIAYSIPRKIYLVSVGNGKLFNIFPTDLSGTIGKDSFILSLRTGGKANEQIENEGKCLVSVMEAEFFEEVYNAGKNHMKALSEISEIRIKLRDEKSSDFNLPVPLGAIKYYELEALKMFEVGIHTLHFLKIINSVELNSNNSILAHIHRDYAGWRIKNGIQSNYLIRK